METGAKARYKDHTLNARKILRGKEGDAYACFVWVTLFCISRKRVFCQCMAAPPCRTEERMEDRIGVIGIVIDDPAQAGEMVNHQISRSASIIRGRMGLPGTEGESSVIALVVAGTTDEIGALTGRLGNIKGVRVKSALAGK